MIPVQLNVAELSPHPPVIPRELPGISPLREKALTAGGRALRVEAVIEPVLKEPRLIVVSAASGSLGRMVVDQLLSRDPGRVAAAVRDPGAVPDLAARGVEVRRGDYDDPMSLRTAFDGADRLLLISSPQLGTADRIRQHLAAVDAAREVGVGAIIYTSFLGAGIAAGAMTEAHHATEQAIVRSALPYTMLRHPFYTEAFLGAGVQAAAAAGELADPTGGRGLNTALKADLAEAAALVLTGDGRHLGRGYDFTGPRWTYPELARTISRVSGRPVAYREGSADIPGAMGWLNGLVRAGALEAQTGDLEAVLGHRATTLEQAVTSLLTTAVTQ